MQKLFVRPVNSLIFVSDRRGGTVPEWADRQILSTSSCISVQCYPEQDGPTEIVVGAGGEVDPGTTPAFDGSLETPSRSMKVANAAHETFLEASVASHVTRVRIWPNHARWADKVIVGLG
jgi:hypothetical protein